MAVVRINLEILLNGKRKRTARLGNEILLTACWLSIQGQGALPGTAETWYGPVQAFKPMEWEEELRGLKAHAPADDLTPIHIPMGITKWTQRTVEERI